MITHPHLLGRVAEHRGRDLLAAAARARLLAEFAAAEPARLRLLLGLLALLAGLLLGAGEAAALPKHQ